MELLIDTEKMRDKGNKIMQIASEMNDTLKQLYDRIEKMPYKTGEWVGPAAVQYVNLLKKEKLEYIHFKDILFSYGKFLVNQADKYEKIINERNVFYNG